MIKILDHTKPLTQLVNDTTNGLGKLDALECFVTEELNGIYEAQLVILQSDKHFKDVALNGLLEINAGEVIGKQIFRIFFISKPIDGKIVIRCEHISYDLNKVAVEPFSATGAVNTKNGMLSHVMGTYPFDMMTDINNSTTYFSLDVPKSFRECLGGWEGSILDKFRCEYEWDNLLVKMLAHRGTDEGVRIAYGKNLTDFKQDENIQNVYTSVLGYAVVNEQTYVGDIYHKIVSNLPKVKIVDFSNDFGDTAPTTAQLTQKAQEYATNNSIEVPNVSIDIKFVPLYQTEEYKNIAPLERVGLGDTVHVFFEKLNVEATSRVVKTVWNALLNKYESVELGDTKANLTTLLDDAVQEAKENITIDAGYIETELNDMSQLIINGLGLHRTLVPVSTGGHRMYLHNKPTLAESDTQYMIGASGFMISTDYGQTWNSGWDADGNVVVNSLATITLRALEIYGSYLCFGDYPNGKYIEASTYSNSSSVQQGVSFNGTGTIRMQPQEAFLVNNLDSNGNLYNDMQMYVSNNQNFIKLRNYDNVYRTELANALNMSTNVSDTNIMQLRNCNTASGTSYDGNSIYLSSNYDTSDSTSTNNLNIINNGQPSTSYGGNAIRLHSDSLQSTTKIVNSYYNKSDEANKIIMNSDNLFDKNNSITLSNGKYNNNNFIANNINLLSSVQNNQLNLFNYEMASTYVAQNIMFNTSVNGRQIYITQFGPGETLYQNEISLIRNDVTGGNFVRINNGRYGTSSSYEPINSISLTSGLSNNTIYILNKDNSATLSNYIRMNSNPSTLDIWANSTITITSAGRVDITSGSSQDIRLMSSDDIHLNYSNKLRWNGYNIKLDSSGYVKWDNT